MSNSVIPPSFQSVTGLGEPICIYKQSRLSKSINVIGCVVGLLIALSIGRYGLVIYPQTFPEVAQTNTPFIVGFGGLVLLGTLYGTWRVFSRWNEMAIVYRDGFAHFNGKEVRAFKWNEIASIRMRVIKMSYYGIIPAGTQRKYTITSEAGDQLKLEGTLSKVEELIDQIRDGIFPHIMAHSKEVFDSGQPVQFGPISISKAWGIQKGNKSYAWGDIAQISVISGVVQVKPRKRGLFDGFGVPVKSIPNVDVLLAIAASMAEQYTQAA